MQCQPPLWLELRCGLVKIVRHGGDERHTPALLVSERLVFFLFGPFHMDCTLQQASIPMMEGVNSNAVAEALLIWLQETVAPRRVLADWARNKEAVSQVTFLEARLSAGFSCNAKSGA